MILFLLLKRICIRYIVRINVRVNAKEKFVNKNNN